MDYGLLLLLLFISPTTILGWEWMNKMKIKLKNGKNLFHHMQWSGVPITFIYIWPIPLTSTYKKHLLWKQYFFYVIINIFVDWMAFDWIWISTLPMDNDIKANKCTHTHTQQNQAWLCYFFFFLCVLKGKSKW